MRITYNITNSKNELLPIATVTLNDNKEFESIETPAGIPNVLSFLDDNELVSTNNGYSLPGIKTIKNLRELLSPPKCITVHAIYKTTANNVEHPENWTLIAGTVHPSNVESVILDYHKKEGTGNANFYPVITIIQVQ